MEKSAICKFALKSWIIFWDRNGEVGFGSFTPKPINREKNVFLWLNLEFNMEVNNWYKIRQQSLGKQLTGLISLILQTVEMKVVLGVQY